MHDEKFVDSFTDKYHTQAFQNDIVLLKTFDNTNYFGKYDSEIKYIKPFTLEFFKIIDVAINFDCIIVYNLDYDKAYLINLIRSKYKKVLILWNFFGTEVYSDRNFKFNSTIYSFDTKNLLTNRDNYFRNIARWVKYKLILKRSLPKNEIRKAINNINYFAWYSLEEYDYIKSEIKYLPKFLKYPLDDVLKNLNNLVTTNKQKSIIIGNSRAAENNHIDIINLLDKYKFKYDVIIPFSYGVESCYATNLKVEIQKKKFKCVVLTDFIPYEKYLKIISTCSTAIYNSYRQLALGNIIALLAIGTKVYLSNKNISKLWLQNEGFEIYSIEDNLQDDLILDDIVLNNKSREINLFAYNNLTSKVNIELYILHLIDLIDKNNIESQDN